MDFQLVVTRGRSSARSLKLLDGVTTVGRQDDCQLRIASSQVSRRHCQLFEHKGFLLVKDLGSSNGTYVNGKKIAEQRVLEIGDELGIGPVKFRVEKNSAVAAAPSPARVAGDTAIVDAIDPAPAAPAVNIPIAKPVVASAPAGPTDVEDATIAINDDDVFEIDFDEAPPEPEEATTAPKATPAPRSPAAPLPPAAKEKDLGEDAVADFLMNLEIDED